MAERFAEEGAALAITGLDEAAGRDIEKRLTGHQTVTFHRADASDSAQVELLFDHAIQSLGGLDILVHVAGRSGREFGDGPIHLCTDEGWSATVSANLTCVFLTNRAAVRYFRERAGGVILNVSSVLALSPAPKHFDTCAYTAAKGAIVSLTRLLAASYASDHIRANVLMPGLIASPMSQRAMNDPEIRRYLERKQPLSSGACEPRDCAEAAVFLCSDKSRHVTGAVFPVDGGWLVSEG